MGLSERRRGHRWEVACANVISDRTGLDVVTTRSLGATYGADLCTIVARDAKGRPAAHIPEVLGWSIECKDVKQRVPKAWLRQAAEQCVPGLTPVVLWNRRHHPFDKSSVFLSNPDAPRGWEELPITEWLDQLKEEAAA